MVLYSSSGQYIAPSAFFVISIGTSSLSTLNLNPKAKNYVRTDNVVHRGGFAPKIVGICNALKCDEVFYVSVFFC